MLTTTAEDRKQAAFRLAQQIALAGSEDDSRSLVDEVKKFIHPAGRRTQAAPDQATGEEETIGIWKAEWMNGRKYFIRDD